MVKSLNLESVMNAFFSEETGGFLTVVDVVGGSTGGIGADRGKAAGVAVFGIDGVAFPPPPLTASPVTLVQCKDI